jgi:hypothetical protein
VLHHPFLFGEIPTQATSSRKNSGTVAWETSSTYTSSFTQSHLLAFTLFAICLSFSSPPLLKCFYKKVQKDLYFPFSICPFICRFPLSPFFLVAHFLASFVTMAISSLVAITPENEVLNFKQRGGEFK